MLETAEDVEPDITGFDDGFLQDLLFMAADVVASDNHASAEERSYLEGLGQFLGLPSELIQELLRRLSGETAPDRSSAADLDKAERILGVSC